MVVLRTTSVIPAVVSARLRSCPGGLGLVGALGAAGAVGGALAHDPRTGLRGAAALLLWGGVLAVALGSGGWLGRELRDGAWTVWAARPGSAPLRYLGCHLAVLGTWMGLLTLATLLAAAALELQHPGTGRLLLARAPGLLVPWLVTGVLVWACGGWGIRSDGLAALALGGALLLAELAAALAGARLGGMAAALDLVGIPLDDLGTLVRGLGASGQALLSPDRGPAGGPDPEALLRALLPSLLWILGWGAVGVAGVARRTGGSRTGPSAPSGR